MGTPRERPRVVSCSRCAVTVAHSLAILAFFRVWRRKTSWFIACRECWGDMIDGVGSENIPPCALLSASPNFRVSRFERDDKPVARAWGAQHSVTTAVVCHGRSIGHMLPEPAG